MGAESLKTNCLVSLHYRLIPHPWVVDCLNDVPKMEDFWFVLCCTSLRGIKCNMSDSIKTALYDYLRMFEDIDTIEVFAKSNS